MVSIHSVYLLHYQTAQQVYTVHALYKYMYSITCIVALEQAL